MQKTKASGTGLGIGILATPYPLGLVPDNGRTEAEPIKVGVLRFGPKKRHGHTTLVTPFAGKEHCFKDYLRGIKTLPTSEMSAIWYDNSGDEKFRDLLINTGSKLFKSFKLLVDQTPAHTIESTTDYKMISWRCHQIYRTIQEHLNDFKYTLILEDDTEMPKGGYDRLFETMERQKNIGTVVGSVASRRLKDRYRAIPIIWHYSYTSSFPATTPKVVEQRILQEKEFGVELIGGAHMACWLTRTPLIKKIGFKWEEDGLRANDQVWGYRLNKAGHWMAVDWSVKCKHHWLSEGVKGWY